MWYIKNNTVNSIFFFVIKTLLFYIEKSKVPGLFKILGKIYLALHS